MYRIPMHVEGVDLDDDETMEAVDEHLRDLTWSQVDGRVIVVVHTTRANPVGAALEVARRIRNYVPNAVVREVDQELVSVSDIAHRVGVSREAVRLWTEGKRGPGGFPASVGAPGTSKVWRWGRVSEWIRKNYAIDLDDELHLSDGQIAQVNCALLRVKEAIDSEWEAVNSFHDSLHHSGMSGIFRSSRGELSVQFGDLMMALQMVDASDLPLIPTGHGSLSIADWEKHP